jgi:hypothetical protein
LFFSLALCQRPNLANNTADDRSHWLNVTDDMLDNPHRSFRHSNDHGRSSRYYALTRPAILCLGKRRIDGKHRHRNKNNRIRLHVTILLKPGNKTYTSELYLMDPVTQ